MEERPKEKEYPFINEIIIPKKKNKWIAYLKLFVLVIFLAVVFGFVARLVFLSSDNYLKDWFGIEKQKIELPILLSSNPIGTSKITLPKEQTSYLEMYQEVQQVSKDMSSCIVIVEIIQKSKDWFQEFYEEKTWTTGLILNKNEKELLILSDTEHIVETASIKVYFGTTEVDGRIYAIDKEYGFTIIAVSLSALSEEVLEQITFAQFREKDISVGLPVIALGGPNGYQNSIEVTMVTSLGHKLPVLDGEVSYFTTDMIEYKNGNGFLFTLDGEVIGMITHTHKKNKNDGICSAICLNDMKFLIEALLNNLNQAKFGIKGEDLPERYRWVIRIGTGERIKKEEEVLYVTEVESGSPAFQMGIRAGDIIGSISGKKIKGMLHFKELLLEHSAGELVQISFIKNTGNGLFPMDKVEVRLTERK